MTELAEMGRSEGRTCAKRLESAGAGQHVVRVKDGEDFLLYAGQAGAQHAAPLQRI